MCLYDKHLYSREIVATLTINSFVSNGKEDEMFYNNIKYFGLDSMNEQEDENTLMCGKIEKDEYVKIEYKVKNNCNEKINFTLDSSKIEKNNFQLAYSLDKDDYGLKTNFDDMLSINIDSSDCCNVYVYLSIINPSYSASYNGNLQVSFKHSSLV